MSYIEVNEIEKIIQENHIFKSCSLTINKDTKMALIGENGSGKSTLFKIILKDEGVSKGSVIHSKNLNIGYLKQQPKYNQNKVIDYLKSSFTKIIEIEQKLHELEKVMETDYSEKVMNKYARLQEEYEYNDGYLIETLIHKTCYNLDINEQVLNQNMNDLSFGQQKIINLAKIMLDKPDVLLLDEPTNHLDFEKIKILENFLNSYKGAFIVISHDRTFINNVTNSIAVIKDYKLNIYNGNYEFYLEQNEVEENKLIKSYYLQQKEISRLKRLIRQYRQWANISDNEKFYKLAKKYEKQLEEMKRIKLPKKINEELLSFDNASRLGDEVLIVKDFNVEYEEVLVENVNLELFRGEKVCILGPNGSGKSSLIKQIMNNIDKNNPKVKHANNMKVGYLEQEINFEHENQSVYEFGRDVINKTESQVRSILHSYGFTKKEVVIKLNKLSGGQRVRLRLMQLIIEKVNFLILDEPTNHLDIITREQLEKSLVEFNGTILFISHDRYLVDKLATAKYEIQDKQLNFISD